MEPDFSGWATKAGLKCTDGRTIMPNAFQHQDQMQVPLVWQHGHTDPENVLGHAILENRPDGVYTYAFFNDSPKAQHAKGLVQHKDINSLSIWANQLIERSSKVIHGVIREVSLVLAGANPGAVIENVSIRHSDGDVELLDEEAVIYTGLELDEVDIQHDDFNEETEIDDAVHADNSGNGADPTIQDIIDSMDEDQQTVLHYLVGEALASTDQGGNLQQSDINDFNNEEGSDMTGSRNVFEKDEIAGPVLSHEDVKGIVADATKTGSLRESVMSYALAHGIENIEILFPEATQLTSSPEFFARRMEWVNNVLDGARKSPFARIKTATADLTFEEARAKGYIKGTLKKEEFFKVSKRVTVPQTIYKKQKLDRDDIIDITDFDVVVWMKGEMRIMLDEELARAILVGDGREPGDEDKINEENIRPIAKDDDFYTVKVHVNIDDTDSSVQEIIDAIVLNRQYMRGSGLPSMYTTETMIARFMLLKDTLGRRIYTSLDQLAAELRVKEVVPVEVLNTEADIACILVNMADYNIGADKGGQVSMFDDFDIDYNQYKYLMETRVSGALVRPKAAMVVHTTLSTAVQVTATAPTFNDTTGVVTVPDVTGVTYKNADTDADISDSSITLDAGESLTVVAVASTTSYFLTTSEGTSWTFTMSA